MTESLEQRITQRAHELWKKEGSPQGREREFHERARLMVQAENSGPVETPLGSRSPEERRTDEAVAQSFPASDPPSFTATVGARTE